MHLFAIGIARQAPKDEELSSHTIASILCMLAPYLPTIQCTDTHDDACVERYLVETCRHITTKEHLTTIGFIVTAMTENSLPFCLFALSAQCAHSEKKNGRMTYRRYILLTYVIKCKSQPFSTFAYRRTAMKDSLPV